VLLICLLAIGCLSGGNLSITPRITAIARWLAKPLLFKWYYSEKLYPTDRMK